MFQKLSLGFLRLSRYKFDAIRRAGKDAGFFENNYINLCQKNVNSYLLLTFFDIDP